MEYHNTQTPTNARIREMAIDRVPSPSGDGDGSDYLDNVIAEYLKLQCKLFPLFCEDTRVANQLRLKELHLDGYKGKYTNSVGWNKEGTFREKWIISDQLKYFMEHIHKEFWDDRNAKVRNSFMKGIIRGDNYDELLGKVYSYYGSNVEKSIK